MQSIRTLEDLIQPFNLEFLKSAVRQALKDRHHDGRRERACAP